MGFRIKDLVNTEAGLLDRRVFTDPEIYQLEEEKIFARCWLYVGHESEIPNPGDYVTAYMGEEPIILCRDSNGQIRAYLNICSHRGNRVCRLDKGNTKFFSCSYHGWIFANDGRLVDVPMMENYRNFDRAGWGLTSVAQLESYQGLIFATFDAKAPSLREYLGDMTWYLDFILDRREGGTEVTGPHRWVLDANWKTAAENFAGDGYHVPYTHSSAIQVNVASFSRKVRDSGLGYQIQPGNGHLLNSKICPPDDAGPWCAQPVPELENYMRQHAPEINSRLGAERAQLVVPIAGTVFPNFSFHWPDHTIRVWHPRGPQKMEIWSWVIVDKAAAPEIKDLIRSVSQYRLSPTGLFEQDDMDNWAQVTSAARGVISKRSHNNYQMNLGVELSHDKLRGRLFPTMSDCNQLALYAHWAKMLEADNWNEILDARPPREVERHG